MISKLALLLFIPLSILGAVLFYKFNNQPTSEQKALVSEIVATPIPSPTPTPGPFDDLTIPYLRERDYESSLGHLERVSENSNYISYLTNYSSDGLKINALLTKPKGEVPNGGWPAIIFIHGYTPPKNYDTLDNYSSYADFLAENGFVVFKIDLRGHGSSEGEGGGAYYSSDYVIDTLNAYAALQKADFVNPEKIGLWGHSMGGNVVMRSFAANPEIPAVVIWAGAVYTYTDLAEYGIDDNSYRPPDITSERVKKRQELLETYGLPENGNPFWQVVAPTNYLNDLKGAIQINHAVDDNVVSIEYSRNLNKLLEETKVEHELSEYQSGGHNLTGATFTKAMENTVEFFDKHLK